MDNPKSCCTPRGLPTGPGPPAKTKLGANHGNFSRWNFFKMEFFQNGFFFKMEFFQSGFFFKEPFCGVEKSQVIKV